MLLLLLAFVAFVHSSNYDRKAAIVHGGLKRFRCVEEWIPVDPFGNLLEANARETGSTRARYEAATAPSTLLNTYIQSQANGADLTVGSSAPKMTRASTIGPFERELLETLEEDPVETEPLKKTTSPPTRGHRFTPRSVPTTTSLPSTTIVVDIGSTTTPPSATTEKVAIHSGNNRANEVAVATSSSPKADQKKLKETPEIRRHETSYEQSRRRSPIRPQNRRRPSAREEEFDPGEADFVDTDFGENSAERETYTRRRPYFRAERYGQITRRYHPERVNRQRHRHEYTDYEDDEQDSYDDYVSPSRRQAALRKDNYDEMEDDFAPPPPALRYGRSRHAQIPLGYGGHSQKEPRLRASHISSLPVDGLDRRSMPLPFLPSVPVYNPPPQPIIPQQYPLATLVTPRPPNAAGAEPRKLPQRPRKRQRQPPRMAFTSLPIQHLPAAFPSHSTTLSPVQYPAPLRVAPMPPAVRFEEATPETCQLMKKLAGDYGITDIPGFARNNCLMLQGMVGGGLSCEQIEHFIASCNRRKFF
ncbi:unnamed protein product, partial [Mesorhabditis spiculigera]